MRIRILLILFVTCLSANARTLSWRWWPLGYQDTVVSQMDTLHWMAGVSAVASSGQFAPFWLHNNTNGDVSSSPYSGNITAGVYKPERHTSRWWDFDFAVQMTGRAQYPASGTGYFNLAYGHVRLLFFDITVGIKPMLYEMQDTLLSSGSFLFSGNSHPIPRITVGIERYTPFPGLFGYMEFKGGLTHGWFADNIYMRGSYLHHKWAGIRVGGKLPVNASFEFHHAAQWGGISPIFGDIGSGWADFAHVFLAQAGGVMRNDIKNALGNHLISQQIMLTGKGTGWEVSIYWQNFLEDNFEIIGRGQNQTDGLWGISMKQNRWPFIQGFTYEFLNTTGQSGPWHDRDGLCYAGDDSYYQNTVFENGWNYFYRTIGTPFITSPIYNTDGTISTLNSRVWVHHVGVRGDIYGFRYIAKISHARNYGNDNTSRTILSRNTAVLLEVNKVVPQAWGLHFGLRLAADFGSQWGNQFGAQIVVRKNGIICKW